MFEVEQKDSLKKSLQLDCLALLNSSFSYLKADKLVNIELLPSLPSQDCCSYNLGTFEGTIQSYPINNKDFDVVIERFSSNDNSVSAFRCKFVNITKSDLVLNKMTSEIDTEGLLRFLDASSIEHLDFVKQARQKNDIPGSFNLSVDDKNLQDAAFLSMNTEAGAGINFNASEAASCPAIYSEPVVHIKNTNQVPGRGLLLGAFGQRKQLCDIIIQADSERKAFAKFDVQLHFDAVVLNAGATVESEWIMLMQEEDCWTAMNGYYESFVSYFNIPTPPKPAPSLYCSWYFYGSCFTEQDLDENLAFLKKNPIPFDIFLLDMGWFYDMGLWDTTKDWPSGMAKVAEKIRAAGYEPGIWTCPFVVMADSPIIKAHPELVAKDLNGNPVRFGFRDAPAYAIDPTCPFAEDYLTELFTRLKSWGYNFHKLDFLRSVEQDETIRFYDKTATRASAYVKGMSIIKNAVGKEGYIIACGGLFEASAGLVHAVRSGSDVRGEWYDEGKNKSSYINRIKQNIFRNYHNRLWHTDPDALMLRISSEPWKNSLDHHKHLSLGSLTNEEAFTTVVNQFLGDGIVCISERFEGLQPERLEMLKYVLPAVESQTRPLDMNNAKCPSLYVTKVKPLCSDIGQSLILTVCNWEDEFKEIIIDLAKADVFENQAVFEFYEQKFYGIKTSNDMITIQIPAHGSRVFRLTKISDDMPKIIGTDLHITSGCAEIGSFRANETQLTARIESKWNCPVNITVLFDAESDPVIINTTIISNQQFKIHH